MALTVVNLISQVEQTLFEILHLSFSKRLDPVANLAALRAAPTLTTRDWALRYVTDQNNLYRWSLYSTAADDGLITIRPSTLPANGRWIRVTNAVDYGPNRFAPLASKQTGFCRSVVLYDGQSPDEMQAQIYGQAPALLIEFVASNPEARSNRPGALYWDNMEFQILVVSECLRPPPAAVMGSELPAESSKDPGLNTLVGLVRYVLAGVRTEVRGIESVEIGRVDILSEDLAERLFVASVQIIVRTSWEIPDEDLEALSIQVEPKYTDNVLVSPFDPQNYIASGMRIAIGPGLTRTPEPGVVLIDGQAVSAAPGAHTFAASSDTWRDLLKTGTMVYTIVAVGALEPPATANSLRLGFTRTSATEIIEDKITCSYSVQFFPPMLIP